MDLRTLHIGLGNALLYFSVLVGLWALYLAWRKQPLDGSYFGALAIGEGLIIALAVVGGLLMAYGYRPAEWVHLLYGIFATIVWPATYVFIYQRNVRDLDPRGQALVFGLVGLFLAGVAIRAMLTAAP